LSKQQAAKKNLTHQQTGGADIALLFGNEQSGLSNDEISHCHYQIHIPSNPDYSSLNLAAAIQIIAYEIYQAQTSHQVRPTPQQSTEERPATADEMTGFYQHLETMLKAVHFLHPDHPKKMTQRLHRLFNRAQPNHNEINILRGILKAIIQQSNQST
jgi:TrmH family RNA methyltransferase